MRVVRFLCLPIKKTRQSSPLFFPRFCIVCVLRLFEEKRQTRPSLADRCRCIREESERKGSRFGKKSRAVAYRPLSSIGRDLAFGNRYEASNDQRCSNASRVNSVFDKQLLLSNVSPQYDVSSSKADKTYSLDHHRHHHHHRRLCTWQEKCIERMIQGEQRESTHSCVVLRRSVSPCMVNELIVHVHKTITTSISPRMNETSTRERCAFNDDHWSYASERRLVQTTSFAIMTPMSNRRKKEKSFLLAASLNDDGIRCPLVHIHSRAENTARHRHSAPV